MIEFQYFSGCPHAKDTLQNLRKVMTEMGIGKNELQIIIVPSPEAAQKIKFQGSPSILVFSGDKSNPLLARNSSIRGLTLFSSMSLSDIKAGLF